jgi:hypothetical protein
LLNRKRGQGQPQSITNPQQLLPLQEVALRTQAFDHLKRWDDAALNACLTFRIRTPIDARDATGKDGKRIGRAQRISRKTSSPAMARDKLVEDRNRLGSRIASATIAFWSPMLRWVLWLLRIAHFCSRWRLLAHQVSVCQFG